jgi:hypothetical protein
MRKLAAAAAAAMIAGCGGISKQELDTVKAELIANDEKMAAQLKADLTGVKGDFVTVQKIEQQVNKKLDELNKLQADLAELAKRLEVKIDSANANVLKVFEFEERLLSERLATVRAIIEELKKK